MTRTANPIRDYYAGDSLTLSVTIKRSDGSLVDLTGTDFLYGFSESPQSTPIFTKTGSGGGVSVIDAPGGKIEIAIDPADTESLSGSYYHELELTDSNGVVSTVFTGDFGIKASMV